MPIFVLRDIPSDLWARVKARATAEREPGGPFRLNQIMFRLLHLYAEHGLETIESGLPPDKSAR